MLDTINNSLLENMQNSHMNFVNQNKKEWFED